MRLRARPRSPSPSTPWSRRPAPPTRPGLTVDPSTEALNVSAGAITNAGGLAASSGAFWNISDFGGDLSDNVLTGSANDFSSNVDTAFANDSYFTITLEADATFDLDIDTLTFDVAKSGTSGVRNWAVRSSLTGATNLAANLTNTTTFLDAPNGGSFDSISIDLSTSGAFGTTFQDVAGPVEFQFIIATDNFFRGVVWEDITLTGDVSVIPEPASLALMGLGGLMLLGRSRR